MQIRGGLRYFKIKVGRACRPRSPHLDLVPVHLGNVGDLDTDIMTQERP